MGEKEDKLLLDVLYQACGEGDGIIDNRCISSYEEACYYLCDKKLLHKINDRTYTILDELSQNLENKKGGKDKNGKTHHKF